jgi:hypothetical protein
MSLLEKFREMSAVSNIKIFKRMFLPCFEHQRTVVTCGQWFKTMLQETNLDL